MDITVKRVSHYKDVKVKLDNTTVELGLMDEEECMALARKLKETISDLIDDRDKTKEFLTSEE